MSGAASSNPGSLTPIGGGRALFVADNGSDYALWVTNGTAAGTKLYNKSC
jgi:hypothetical protein